MHTYFQRLFAVCVVVSAVALGVGCARESAAREDAPPASEAPPVEALAARTGTLPLEERVSGTVKAHNQVTVRAEIEAPIVEVYVRSGESVERGQALVRLQDDGLREQLRRAEASVRLAEATALEAAARREELEARVERTRSLAEQQLISEQELDTLEAQLAGARAAAAQAEARVDESRAFVDERRTAVAKAVVRSPVSGRVGRRNAEVGMIANAGSALFVVGNLDSLIVEIPLTEEMLGFIEEGLPVRIGAPVLRGTPLRAELSRISPFLTPGTFSTTGEIDLDNRDGRLKPGMFVTVDVLYGETTSATIVPASALWQEPSTGQWGIYVIGFGDAAPAEDDTSKDVDPEPRSVEFRLIDVLAEGRDRTGVRGVEPGEWVVVLGQHLLRPESGAVARVRVASWERVLELQELQREDLLQGFLDKQQRWAREHGAKPPTNREFLGEGPAGVTPAGPTPTAAVGGQ